MGEAGVVSGWSAYHSIRFDAEADDLHSEDMRLVSQNTEYMNLNPTLRIGIDNTHPSDSAHRTVMGKGRLQEFRKQTPRVSIT
jgi:hypothetical protein